MSNITNIDFLSALYKKDFDVIEQFLEQDRDTDITDNETKFFCFLDQSLISGLNNLQENFLNLEPEIEKLIKEADVITPYTIMILLDRIDLADKYLEKTIKGDTKKQEVYKKNVEKGIYEFDYTKKNSIDRKKIYKKEDIEATILFILAIAKDNVEILESLEKRQNILGNVESFEKNIGLASDFFKWFTYFPPEKKYSSSVCHYFAEKVEFNNDKIKNFLFKKSFLKKEWNLIEKIHKNNIISYKTYNEISSKLLKEEKLDDWFILYDFYCEYKVGNNKETNLLFNYINKKQNNYEKDKRNINTLFENKKVKEDFLSFSENLKNTIKLNLNVISVLLENFDYTSFSEYLQNSIQSVLINDIKNTTLKEKDKIHSINQTIMFISKEHKSLFQELVEDRYLLDVLKNKNKFFRHCAIEIEKEYLTSKVSVENKKRRKTNTL